MIPECLCRPGSRLGRGVCVCVQTHGRTHLHTRIIPTVDKSKMKCSGQGPGASDGKQKEVTKDAMELSSQVHALNQNPTVPWFSNQGPWTDGTGTTWEPTHTHVLQPRC